MKIFLEETLSRDRSVSFLLYSKIAQVSHLYLRIKTTCFQVSLSNEKLKLSLMSGKHEGHLLYIKLR